MDWFDWEAFRKSQNEKFQIVSFAPKGGEGPPKVFDLTALSQEWVRLP